MKHDCFLVHKLRQFPVLITPLLWKQHGKGIFSVFDPKHGYHQMPFAKSSQDATCMSSPLGLMRWKVMPMGVKNGNA